MDNTQIGKLILSLRKEKGWTQKQLADKMNLSDRTISKWERGLGCPDVSLLPELSEVLEMNIERILTGNMQSNEKDGGNMRRIKFYTCPACGNIVTATGEPEVSCCGRKLEALLPKPEDTEHFIRVEEMDGELYITFSHDMKKEHYINFIAYADYDRMLLTRLYPEQGNELRFPKIRRGKLYFGCSQHGLWVHENKK